MAPSGREVLAVSPERSVQSIRLSQHRKCLAAMVAPLHVLHEWALFKEVGGLFDADVRSAIQEMRFSDGRSSEAFQDACLATASLSASHGGGSDVARFYCASICSLVHHGCKDKMTLGRSSNEGLLPLQSRKGSRWSILARGSPRSAPRS